jgi:hypothetical protein
MEAPVKQSQLWAQDELTKAAKPRPAGQGTDRELFARLDADLFLANQLFRQGRSSQVLAGVTGFAERRERIRREILAADVDEAPVLGQRGERLPETLGAAFERLYSEPLIPTTKGTTRADTATA